MTYATASESAAQRCFTSLTEEFPALECCLLAGAYYFYAIAAVAPIPPIRFPIHS